MSIHLGNQEKAKKLSELIGYYELCNRAEGKSPKTVSWYSANLRCFCSYLERRHLPDSMDNIDTKLLREYVIYLLKRNRFENHLARTLRQSRYRPQLSMVMLELYERSLAGSWTKG